MTAGHPPGRKPWRMSGTSLLFIAMPIVVPILLAVLIALPFLAARNPGTAANQRPPEDQASPDAA
jgi:hypothetical protein